MKREEVKIEKVVIGFKITSLDTALRVCNLSVTVKNVDESGSVVSENSRLMKGVYVSRLLCWNVDSGNGSIEVGKYYESKLMSGDFKENPLSLLKYTDKDGSDRLLLTTVSERPSIRVVVEDPLGGTYVDWKHRYYKKSEFKRYRDFRKK